MKSIVYDQYQMIQFKGIGRISSPIK